MTETARIALRRVIPVCACFILLFFFLFRPHGLAHGPLQHGSVAPSHGRGSIARQENTFINPPTPTPFPSNDPLVAVSGRCVVVVF